MIDLRIHDETKTRVADAPDDCNTREFFVEIVRALHPGSKAEDWDLTADGPGGKPLLLDRTLEENQVHSHQDLYLVAKVIQNPIVCRKCKTPNLPTAQKCVACGASLLVVDDLSIEVIGPDGKSRQCMVAGDTPVAEFLSDLLGAFALPKLDGEGRPIEFALLDQQSEVPLDRSKTLDENGVIDGQHLVLRDPRGPDKLRLEVTAPDQRKQHIETPLKTPGAELIAILLEQFELPRSDAKGKPIAYFLSDHKTGALLDSKKTLAENGVVTGQHLLLQRPASEPDAVEPAVLSDMRLIGVAPDGRSRPCIVAPDTPTRELLGDLLEHFGLPKMDAAYQPIRYVLLDRQSGKALNPQLTVGQNGVVTGQQLLIKHEHTVPPPPPPVRDFFAWFRENPLRAGLALVAVIAAIVLVWAVITGMRDTGRPVHKPVNPPVHRGKPTAENEAAPALVALDPLVATLSPSQPQQFTLSGIPESDGPITWTLNPNVGTVSDSGLYTAPAEIAQAQTVTLTAAGKEGTNLSTTATISLTPPRDASTNPAPNPSPAPSPTSSPPVKIFPAQVSLDASQSRQFAVRPSPGTQVQWSLQPRVGSISANGVYTAPPLISAQQNVKVIASAPEPVTANVTLQPVAITAITTARGSNRSVIFTANVSHSGNPAVKWSIDPQIGSITQEGVYTPAERSAYNVKVTARSVADPTKFALVVLPVEAERESPVRVVLNHFNPVVVDRQRERITATVTGAADTSVTWAMVGLGNILPDGTYVAPQQVPPGDHTIHIVATSNADPSKRGEGEFILRHGYSGPKQGTLVWSGNLEKNSVLTITGSQASSGQITGELPGAPVSVRLTTQKCVLLTSPAASNGWKQIVIRTGAHLRSISIDWNVEP